ncbi:MFS transporter [Nocardioides sp.]|uniref:MFS transporter n=1 Tax=Nocardioides sp. TaxID=35761 RepID=UPI0039E57BD8
MARVATPGNRLVPLTVFHDAPRVPVALVFALNGLLFATIFSRLADVRTGLELSNSALGLLLLTGSLGSMSMLPTTGRIIQRLGPAASVRVGAAAVGLGMVVTAVGVGPLSSRLVTGVALFCYGAGVSLWDVAMNVEGAEVERRLGRTIMPRFHAAWSGGSILGSGLGIPMAAGHVPLLVHCLVVTVPVLLATSRVSRSFLPAAASPGAEGPKASAWREPRTLLIGLMVLCFATVEGTANDWLSLAVIDGYDTPHWVGVTGFATFVAAMTAGRLLGPFLLDKVGRPAALWASCAAAAAGVLLAVFGGSLPVALIGVVIWGLGAALGFPVGMSAAADDPARAAARVSVVATIGYAAFLGGPPLLGMLGDAIGTLHAITVVAILMVPAAISVLAARPSRS